MVISTEATQSFQRAFYEALEMMQQVTSSFKVVVFTDDVTRAGLRDFDWAIEHCFSESNWHKISHRNWLEMAAARVQWAQRAYGVGLLTAPTDAREVPAALRRVARVFEIPDSTLRTAIAHFSGTVGDSASSSRNGLRGWLHQVEEGVSKVPISLPGGEAFLTITKSDAPGVFIGHDSGEWTRAAQQAGWSSIEVTSVAGEVSPAVLASLAGAACDAFLDSDGPAVVAGLFPDGVEETLQHPKVLAVVNIGTGLVATAFGSSTEANVEDIGLILQKLNLAHRSALALTI
ncbi:hypothetical protein [Nesterenkonia sp. HG001]|uniref:hypothetical protein n=1 Tax=Nesterenkonia sp. HG001 TaxID=2983207 RepID=UPI002AC77528|nr:hypothetical protein [Nesterenkonia sp. HG001]MDZ5076984.1 hypothetical protein [Nesterenkonia sp. HG001]